MALGLLLLGPWALGHVLFGQNYTYGRVGLALIGIGMGFHLCSGALNQAALARNRARAAAACWLLAACAFIVWMLSPLVGEELLRAEIGYVGRTAAAGRCCCWTALPPRHRPRPAPPPQRNACSERSISRKAAAGSGAVEDRRAGHEQPRPRLRAGGSRARVDAAVHLDRHPVADQRAQPRELLQRVLDERLPAPARVDGHAERDVDRFGRAPRAPPTAVAGLIATPTPRPSSRIRLAA